MVRCANYSGFTKNLEVCDQCGQNPKKLDIIKGILISNELRPENLKSAQTEIKIRITKLRLRIKESLEENKIERNRNFNEHQKVS